MSDCLESYGVESRATPDLLEVVRRGLLLLANLGDLSSISMMGSAGFLIIFATVNAANVKLADAIESRRWISAAGVIACIIALAALIWQSAATTPTHLWVLAGMLFLSFGVELGYRRYRRHEIRI